MGETREEHHSDSEKSIVKLLLTNGSDQWNQWNHYWTDGFTALCVLCSEFYQKISCNDLKLNTKLIVFVGPNRGWRELSGNGQKSLIMRTISHRQQWVIIWRQSTSPCLGFRPLVNYQTRTQCLPSIRSTQAYITYYYMIYQYQSHRQSVSENFEIRKLRDYNISFVGPQKQIPEFEYYVN